jgi:hypothetical protein
MKTPDDLSSDGQKESTRKDPTPFPINNRREETLLLLKGITKALDSAMNSRNPVEFNRLCQQRKKLLENLASSGEIHQINRETIKSMEDESRKWLTQGRAMLDAIRAEIERLQIRKNTSKQVGNAYGYGRGPYSGRFFSNRG